MKQVKIQVAAPDGNSEKLMAVWSYDQFPYLLMGEVDGFRNGNPYIPSYQGCFKTTCLLPLEPTGNEFRKKITDMKQRRNMELDKVSKRYKKELDALKSEYGVIV